MEPREVSEERPACWGRTVLVLAAMTSACSGHARSQGRDEVAPPAADNGDAGASGTSQPAGSLDTLTPPEALTYLQYLAKTLAGRVLSEAEETQLQETGQPAITPILAAWMTEEGFSEFARDMVETHVHTGGQTLGEIDYQLPGRIVTHVVRNNLPWAEVLTGSSCYDADDAEIPCDTGAPFGAGVLATRAFLASNGGSMNLARAGTWLGAFACRRYPFEEELEPLVESSRLIGAVGGTGDEPDLDLDRTPHDPDALSCHRCHGQTAPHAQLFVKFDNNGLWDATATGLQAEGGFNRSHYADSEEAGSERSQMFGVDVDNLAEAAAVFSSHDAFVRCAVQSLLSQAAGLELDTGEGPSSLVPPELGDEIIAGSRADSPQLTLASLAVSTFGNPRVEQAVVEALGLR